MRTRSPSPRPRSSRLSCPAVHRAYIPLSAPGDSRISRLLAVLADRAHILLLIARGGKHTSRPPRLRILLLYLHCAIFIIDGTCLCTGKHTSRLPRQPTYLHVSSHLPPPRRAPVTVSPSAQPLPSSWARCRTPRSVRRLHTFRSVSGCASVADWDAAEAAGGARGGAPEPPQPDMIAQGVRMGSGGAERAGPP